MNKLIIILIFLPVISFAQSKEFINAADLSFREQLYDNNARFFLDGDEKPLLDIFHKSGFTFVRLRIWHSPTEGYNDLESTLQMALDAKQAGLNLYLDFHYSDWWADPGKQNKPAAWQNLDFETLVDSLYQYTFNVITALKEQDTPPEIVQIGNEISNGFLWDTGRITDEFNTHEQWTNFTSLLNAGYDAVNDALGQDNNVKIMIHTDRGGDNTSCRWFFNKLLSYGGKFDLIGLSYYPWWHGSLQALKDNLDDLTWRYEQEIFIAETAYPFTLANQDNTNNFVWEESQLPDDYPATPTGQKNYYKDLLALLKSFNGKVIGLALWEPAFRGIPGMNSPWENQLLFDFYGNSLPALEIFQQSTTGELISAENPVGFYVAQNYPNPFNGTTRISFVLESAQQVKIEIYDILGNLVDVVANNNFNAGENNITYNSTGLTSGVYFYKISTSSNIITKAMLLLK